ncbi:hypothetical protein N802_17150 [Knoellia sinensis KCTC 19936]|uniref:Coagulation factor 5/8 type n=1 Tax=Knoellia sinensis KCTC 19936 TaxID=1385520 RepID=A0A0A0JAP1_9MICO|nr:alpha-(1->3)-arabinofuranosyltransferase family protein [Knoellia sinensis]KGN32686.1 hypothetical protein N802_17150 [Knoellia sinensis KCTC 19936]
MSTETRVLVTLSLLLAVVVLANAFGVLTPDTKPEIFLQPAQTAARFSSSWLDTPNLGTSNYNAGVVPVAAMFSLLDVVGIPAWLIMRLWRFGLILAAAWGARLVMRELLGDRVGSTSASVATVAAAVAYAANPYVLVGGGTTPTMLPYALLPWLVVCWLRGFRAPSWRWAAASALVLAGMSGLNAGVVPLIQLIVIVPVVLHALYVEGRRFWSVTWLIVRTGLIYAVLSAYWLVPAIAALGVGTSIAEATESTDAINAVNSFPEVLRGLGMWTLYGGDAAGPFDPERLSYVMGPIVILLTFGGPILAGLAVRLSRSSARLFGATSILVGALVMVGTFPTDDKSSWGRLVAAALDNIPGLIAFRTTNKAGAVLELGMAVLVGLAAQAILPHLKTSTLRWTAFWSTVAIVAGSVAPALSGGMYWVRMDVPDYWNEAAGAVNARPGDSRVLMVPGTGVPGYSWGYTGPDEIGPSLFRRPFVFRSASPSGGVYSANLLAEVDRRLQQGTLPPGTVSALAAYIGAGDVVGRYDVQGTREIGARVEQQLEADPGLAPAVGYGPAEPAHGAPSPAMVRSVAGELPVTSAAARAAAGSLVVDGAGTALPSLQSAGLLEDRPGLLLGGSLDDTQLSDALRDESRVVLTDSNGRREWSNHNPAVAGPLLEATVEPDSTRALFDTSDQTVAVVRGNARLETRGEGLLFGPHAFGNVTQAFDNDRTTGWQFGNFRTGVGNAVVVTPRTALPMPTIVLSPMQGGTNRITDAKVTAVVSGRSIVKDVKFTAWNSFPVSVELSGEPVSSLTIEVTGVEGEGSSPVGFAEISIPGITIDRVAALPTRLTRRLPPAAETAGVDLDEVPLDVILHRSLGDANGLSTEEPRLEREFTLPDERRFEGSGTVRLAGGVTDAEIDTFAGISGEVVAQSSSRAFGNPNARASMALDDRGGDPDESTAWVPNEPVVGEWISVDFPQRRLSSFTFSQGEGGSRGTKALVSVNDGETFEVALDAGTTRITLPEPVDATKVRLLFTERTGAGFVRVTNIGLPRIGEAGEPPSGCTQVGTIDGQPLEADVRDGFPYLLEGQAIPFKACGAGLALGEGRHRLASVPTFAIDDLRLTSTGTPPQQVQRPTYTVVRRGSSSMDLRLTSGCSPCLVSSGQAFDPRWTASVRDKDQGAPLVVDGFAAGWRVNAAPGDVIHITFGPSGTALTAWLVSGAALLACLTLLVVRPRAGGRPTTKHRRGGSRP